jgi:Flp pilus assembly pilin Flp
MKTARKNKVKFLKNQKGQGMVEYILLLVVVIGLVFAFKGKITAKFNDVMGKTEQGMDNVVN